MTENKEGAMRYEEEFPLLSINSREGGLIDLLRERLVEHPGFEVVHTGHLMGRKILLVRMGSNTVTLELPRQLYVDIAAPHDAIVDLSGGEAFGSFPNRNMTTEEILQFRADQLSLWFWEGRFVGSLYLQGDTTVLVSTLLERGERTPEGRTPWTVKRVVEEVPSHQVPVAWLENLRSYLGETPVEESVAAVG